MIILTSVNLVSVFSLVLGCNSSHSAILFRVSNLGIKQKCTCFFNTQKKKGSTCTEKLRSYSFQNVSSKSCFRLHFIVLQLCSTTILSFHAMILLHTVYKLFTTIQFCLFVFQIMYSSWESIQTLSILHTLRFN